MSSGGVTKGEKVCQELKFQDTRKETEIYESWNLLDEKNVLDELKMLNQQQKQWISFVGQEIEELNLDAVVSHKHKPW